MVRGATRTFDRSFNDDPFMLSTVSRATLVRFGDTVVTLPRPKTLTETVYPRQSTPANECLEVSNNRLGSIGA